MKPLHAPLLLLMVVAAASCGKNEPSPTLLEARQNFRTRLLREESTGEAAEIPPAGILKLVSYPAPLGSNAAYVGPAPVDGRKHPAIIWLVGGFSNSIGSIAWSPGPKNNDQSASGFRDSGIVMMYPSLRGGNNNPGYIETFYGEVDDVLAAAKYLASLNYVDSSRIYLGGHSTGGTLALLVGAASGDRFRAVFSLGPVENVIGYGADVLPFDLKNPLEGKLREPQRWLKDIRCPTIVFEGTRAPSNFGSLRALERRSTNPLLRFIPVEGATHFSAIAPTVDAIRGAIVADAAPSPRFQFDFHGAEK